MNEKTLTRAVAALGCFLAVLCVFQAARCWYLYSIDIGAYNRVRDIFLYSAGAVLAVFIVLLFFCRRSERFREQSAENQVSFYTALTYYNDAVITTDRYDVIRSWNRGAEEMFGYKEKEAVGAFIDIIIPHDLIEKGEKNLIETLTEPTDVIVDFVTERTNCYGRRFPVSITYALVRNDAGAAVKSLQVIKDISRQKLMEGKIEQSEKLVALGQLAANLAHEIGTPLNVINGTVEYLLIDMDKSAHAYSYLRIVEREVERISKLMQRLMDISKPGKLNYEEVNINILIQEIFDLVKPQLDSSRIKTVLNFDADLPPIFGDKQQLEEVFLNIIVNAWQAMLKGGVIIVTTNHRDIGQETERVHQRFVEVIIADTGIGIPEHYLQRIFDPYFTTKDERRGTGLGLAIAYRIVEDHQGVVSVRSREGEGTEFKIVLPAGENRTPAEERHGRDVIKV